MAPRGNYRETDVPNPTNFYGFLKAATEIVATERGATIARVSGVNGPHWARPLDTSPTRSRLRLLRGIDRRRLGSRRTLHSVGIRPHQFQSLTISGFDVWRGHANRAADP